MARATCHDGPMKVLVVEDDPAVSEPLLAGLQRNGIETEHVVYASQVVMAAQNVDVVLLDLGLPDGDGIDVLRELRKNSDVPVIIATARGDETDRIVGLELGADDYVVKPFSVRELAARVRAVARRRRIDTSLESGRLVVDRMQHRVLVDGEPVELTAKEFDLLAVLAEEPGRAVPRQELFSRVWDPVWIGTGKTLDVHVASLRKKLGDAELIETVRGVGYRLAVDKA
jgi:two-component system response regulator RegX3